MNGREGFTLLETLVVLLLIGLLARLVLPSFGFLAERRLREEAEGLEARMRLAMETAQIEGREIGFAISLSGYRFLTRTDEDAWRSSGEEALRPHDFTADVTPSLTIGTLPSRLTAPDAAPDADRPPVPALIFSSEGETEPFDLTLHQAKAGEITLRSDGVALLVSEEAHAAP